MPHRSSVVKIRHKFFRRKSVSFTKIDEFDESKDESENEVKNVAASSKTWTSTMGKSLRRKLNAFRKDTNENDSAITSKALPERVNVINFRKSSHRNNANHNINPKRRGFVIFKILSFLFLNGYQKADHPGTDAASVAALIDDDSMKIQVIK